MADRKAGYLFMRAAHGLSRSSAGKRFLDVVTRSVLIQRATLGGPNPIRVWETDTEFKAVLADVRPLSLNRPQSLFNLYQLARTVREVPGEVAEIGVYKGGTARLLAQVLAGTDKQIYLFDTFQGMPDSIDAAVDDWKPGDFGDTSLEGVRQALAGYPAATCVPGIFPESAGPAADRRFALVHVDVDIAQSVRDCCDFFYPRLTTGGVLAFDDYGFLSCAGAKIVVDEYFADKPEQPIYLPTGQCVVFRGPSAAVTTTPVAATGGAPASLG